MINAILSVWQFKNNIWYIYVKNFKYGVFKFYFVSKNNFCKKLLKFGKKNGSSENFILSNCTIYAHESVHVLNL